MRLLPLLLLVAFVLEEKPLTPAEAIPQVGKIVLVEMTIQASKERLEKHGEIYLDCEKDFREPKNLAAVINRAGAVKFKEAGIANPAEHFLGKTIRVSGTVTLKDERPRILVEEPKQIVIVEKK